MAIYLDFFLQVFVHALAWCLAIGVTVVAVVVGLFTWAQAPGFRRRAPR